jgi:hypothetical protein
VQVEPTVWMLAEEGQTPIFQMVGSQAEYVDRYDVSKGIRPSAAGTAYYGNEFRGHAVADLCDRFNRGERWV